MLTAHGNALIPYATKLLSLSANMKDSLSSSDRNVWKL